MHHNYHVGGNFLQCCQTCLLQFLLLREWVLVIHSLVTIGDAVTSFLEITDLTTAGLCLVDKFSVGDAIKALSSAKSVSGK